MNKLFNDIDYTFEEFIDEAKKFIQNGNKAAGIRARKKTIELEKLFKEFRKRSIEESKKKSS